MRISQIRSQDISNGEGVGIALFVQGCDFHCFNCFNSDTWDFTKGKNWNKEQQDGLLFLLNREYIRRVSILGGEPLHDNNVDDVIYLLEKIREDFPTKKIWIYTGYTWEEAITNSKRAKAISLCDVVIDGRYVHDLRDSHLKWRGSSNQRVIDVQKTIQNKDITLWCD